MISWLIANGHRQIAACIKAGDHRFTKPKEPIYPLAKLAVGDSFGMPAHTLADRKRIARNVSQYGMRHGKGFRCKTDKTTLVMTVTRVR